jgi:hypothetical protein
MRESTKVMKKTFKFPLIFRRYKWRGIATGGVANESGKTGWPIVWGILL